MVARVARTSSVRVGLGHPWAWWAWLIPVARRRIVDSLAPVGGQVEQVGGDRLGVAGAQG